VASNATLLVEVAFLRCRSQTRVRQTVHERDDKKTTKVKNRGQILDFLPL